MSRAGWSLGIASASKVFQSVSICGPSSTTNPSSAKIWIASRRTWVNRCRWPPPTGRAGSVMSIVRARSSLPAVSASSPSRAATRSSIACLTLLAAARARARSPAGSRPSSFMTSDSLPFLPRNPACAARIACSSPSGAIAASNSSPRRSRLAIRSLAVGMGSTRSPRRPGAGQNKTATLAEPPMPRSDVGGLRASDLLERHGVADRDLGEHLAIERDAGGAELAHQLRIAVTEPAGRGVDPLDPQRAEVALADLARAVHVHPRMLHRLVGDRVAARTLAAEAAGGLEHAVATATGLESSFCAGHGESSLLVRQELLDLVMLRVGDEGGVARLAPPLLAPVRHQVALVDVRKLELAGRGALEPLLCTRVGLDLGHGCFRVTGGVLCPRARAKTRGFAAKAAWPPPTPEIDQTWRFRPWRPRPRPRRRPRRRR